ncbi:type II secretion system F family protein [Rhizobacter sp. OV335]|uniref:type II secretion system F family protein n=1 Tax=Rhizobacter sp. OV335 TaxID=1500264 RepID=UPI00091E3F78|nr:type II secretion system F family protein [Rhizobacter sp. OV335]SHM90738.1 Type II secretion system (T2SS), protein F [Rhizobacter sp. OV335]
MTFQHLDLTGMALLFRQLAGAHRRQLSLQDVANVYAQDPGAPVAAGVQPLRVLQALARGEPLSAALREAQPAFADDTVSWVIAGEQHGTLADTLDSLALDFERQQRSASVLRVALVWPACVAVAIVGLFAVGSIFVVPSFVEVYDSFGVELPVLTRWLFAAGHLASSGWWVWLPLLLVAVGLAVAGKLPRRVQRWAHDAAGGLGFVSRLRHASFVARGLGLLQRHHGDRTDLAAALAHLAATTPTRRLAAAARQLRAGVHGTDPLSQALATQPAWPPRVPLFIRLGEKVGDLPSTLSQLNADAAQELEIALARFERGAILTLYLLLGLVAGILVLGIYLPIFKLGSII